MTAQSEKPLPSPSAKAALDAVLVGRLSPCQVLAVAIADFQADLAMTDGPSHQPGRPDERLAALVLRLIAQLAAAKRNDPLMGYGLYDTTALDDFADMLDEDANRVLRSRCHCD